MLCSVSVSHLVFLDCVLSGFCLLPCFSRLSFFGFCLLPTAVYFASGEHLGLFGIYFYEMHISRNYLYFTQLFLGDWTMTPIYAQIHVNFEANQLTIRRNLKTCANSLAFPCSSFSTLFNPFDSLVALVYLWLLYKNEMNFCRYKQNYWCYDMLLGGKTN